MSRNLYLGVALEGAGWHPAAWTETRTRPSTLLTAAYWIEQVAEARRGLLDFVTIEDSYRPRGPAVDAQGRPLPDPVRGRLDAVMIAARVAPQVRDIGLLPAVTTTLTEPFLVSTQIATLDFISAGRAGWLAQVSPAEDASYVGPRSVPTGTAMLVEATDHIEVVRRLWDSWEDDAEIRDAVTNRFLDRDRIHPIDFTGKFFSVKGPSITPRPPQGQPIVAMLGAGQAAIQVADRCADLVLLRAPEEQALRTEIARLESVRAQADGVHAQAPHVLADLAVFLDSDRARAMERRARLDAVLSTPIQDRPLVFAGTPEELADRLIELRELGLNGFRLHPAVIPHDLEAVTRSLLPLLQRRGVYRSAYEADTLRGLLGLPRPANRYAARAAQEPVMQR